MRTSFSPTIRRFSAVAAGSALLAGALVVASPISPAQAATSATFSYTGSTTTWPVPSGVQKLTGTAQGGSGAAGGATAGKAGITTALLDVSGSSSLLVNVGGAGSAATGGFNGGGNGGTGDASGGGGGGASDIRTATSTASRILVGPGGGGGGADARSGTGGNGGSGSQNGAAGTNGTNNNAGEGTGGAAAAVSGGQASAGGNGNTGSFYKGGGGGGGGGGYAGGAGGGGGSRGLASAGGGGGGGAGNSFPTSGATYSTATGTGNGTVSLSWIDITNTGLPTGVNGEAYPTTTLAATGGTGSYTWTLNNPVDLPAGLSWTAGSATLSGTPTANADVTLSFTVVDSAGNQTSASFELDVVPGSTIVLDSPATNVGITSATANGRVNPRGSGAITSIYCKVSTSSDTSGGTQVTASPSSVADGSSYTDFTCPLTGLAASTTYYYNVFAVQGGTTTSSQSPQSFQTDAKNNQTFNAPFPTKIKPKGLTTLLSKKSYTSAGNPVKVTLSKSSKSAYDNRGDIVYYTKVTTKKGKVSVRTYGRQFYLKVKYSASGNSSTNAYSQEKVYLVRK